MANLSVHLPIVDFSDRLHGKVSDVLPLLCAQMGQHILLFMQNFRDYNIYQVKPNFLMACHQQIKKRCNSLMWMHSGGVSRVQIEQFLAVNTFSLAHLTLSLSPKENHTWWSWRHQNHNTGLGSRLWQGALNIDNTKQRPTRALVLRKGISTSAYSVEDF